MNVTEAIFCKLFGKTSLRVYHITATTTWIDALVTLF